MTNKIKIITDRLNTFAQEHELFRYTHGLYNQPRHLLMVELPIVYRDHLTLIVYVRRPTNKSTDSEKFFYLFYNPKELRDFFENGTDLRWGEIKGVDEQSKSYDRKGVAETELQRINQQGRKLNYRYRQLKREQKHSPLPPRLTTPNTNPVIISRHTDPTSTKVFTTRDYWVELDIDLNKLEEGIMQWEWNQPRPHS